MRWTILIPSLLLASLLSCSTAAPPRTPGMEALDVEITTAELRLKTYELESYFAAVVQTAADEILAAETEPAIRRAALRWKLNAIPAMQAAVFQLDPLGALADAWGLCRQMEEFFTNGAGRELFGDSQSIAIEESRLLSTEVRLLALSVIGAERLEEVRPRLEAWLAENPFHDISFGRRTVAASASSITAANSSRDALASVGQIEDLVRDLSDRLAIYAEQIPEIARWHAELLTMDISQNEIAPLWEDIESIDASAASLDIEIQALRRFVESTPDLIASERVVILEAIERDLETALVDVDRQRVATLSAVTVEREAILAEIEVLRETVTRDLEQALVDVLSDAEALVERQAATLMVEAEGLVDLIFWRLLVLVAIGCVGLAIALRLSRAKR